MENENKNRTVAGNATSELTDGKINRAIDEIKVFIAEDIILRNYNWKFIKHAPIRAFSLVISFSNMDGISNYAAKRILTANFIRSDCHWINGSNGSISFLFSIA